MSWTKGSVCIKVNLENGRRSFYMKPSNRSGGTSGSRRTGGEWTRVSKADVRARYPSMRFPSTAKILERSAGRQIEVRIENNTDRALRVAFYDRNGGYLERRFISSKEIPVAPGQSTTVPGPKWKWTTRQYIVVAFEASDTQFPTVVRPERFGPRAARIGFNLSKTFLVSGDTLDTLQFD